MKKKIPKFILPCLWSYNVKELGLEKDKEIIITQVLNYGDKKRIKWLYSIYAENEIKKIISHPKRGLWFRKVLNFWLVVLNLKIPHKTFQKAVMGLSMNE